MSRIIALIAAFVGCCQPVAAQHLATTTKVRGTLSFDANATLGAFTGVTSMLSGELRGAATLDSVRGWVEAPSASLSTNNGHRDRDMASSLDITHFPTLRFDLDRVSVHGAAADSIPVTLYGRFTIHGETRPDSLAGWIWVHAGGGRFRGATTLHIKQFGVGGLSKALGMLRMNEQIVVRVDVEFGG